jgi:HAD superfamily hydrolase (TIGR01490 family)
MNLALFDLDHTLIPGDSDYEWGQFLVRRGVVDGVDYKRRNDAFFAQYNDGSLDILEFLKFAFVPLHANSRATLDAWHAEYMRDVITPLIRPQALALVREHLDAGDLCAIVTATNSFVTRPIAQLFGVEHLIATEPEVVAGEFTGNVAGVPCFQDGKITRTTAWLASLGKRFEDFATSSFYSDSANDIPLLERVTRPVAVNPSNGLRSYALTRNWPVVELFA